MGVGGSLLCARGVKGHSSMASGAYMSHKASVFCIRTPRVSVSRVHVLGQQPSCDVGGIPKDAVIKAIDPTSPCAGLVGLGDQLVAINGYRIAYVLSVCVCGHECISLALHP